MGLEDIQQRCFGENVTIDSCPEHIYYSLVPQVFFWVTVPFQLLALYNFRGNILTIGAWTWTRLLLILALFANEVVDIVRLSKDEEIINHLPKIAHSIAAVTYVASAIGYYLSLRMGRRSNGFVVVTFMLLFMTQLARFVTLVLDRPLVSIEITTWFRLVVVTVANVLFYFKDMVKVQQRHLSVEENSSFFAKAWFRWLDPLMVKGYKKALIVGDLPQLSERDISETTTVRFQKEWNRRREASVKMKDCFGTSSSFAYTKRQDTEVKPSLLRSLFRVYKKEVYAVAALRVVADIVYAWNPFLLKFLIDVVSAKDSPLSFGIFCAMSMFYNAELRSFLYNNYIFSMFQTGMRMQSALTNCLFQKSLRLSTAARNQRSVGEVVTLIAVDAEKVSNSVQYIVEGFSIPFQITVAMLMLFYTIGKSAFVAMAVLLLYIPMYYYTAKYTRKCQVEQLKVKEERTKICNEVLNGIKLIKLYAWEEAFEARINKLREEETNIVRRINMAGRIVDVFNLSGPTVVALVTFACYVLSSAENILTPQVAFVSIAYINQIRVPCRFAYLISNSFVQAAVSLKRMERFLLEEEREELQLQPADTGKSVQLKNASFNWKGLSHPAEIHDMSIDCKHGELVTVVGSVGSGKSSMLSAILGEMYTVKGSICLSGTIAYVPQQAWVQNTTLRKNITFGKKYNSKLYKLVIEASELKSDFEQMEHGDKTEVGENGVTLSGGQKARISIARALYQEADIYLLDDCLSAVDAHVGAAVFANAFGKGGFLKGKTRILVTHGLQYTKFSDRTIVLKDGMVTEEGTFSELIDNNGAFAQMIRDKEKQSEEHRDSLEDSLEEGADNQQLTFEELDEMIREPSIRRKRSTIKSDRRSLLSDEGAKLVKEEHMEAGKIKAKVYLMYIRAATYICSLLFIGFFFVHIGLTFARNLWLSDWTYHNLNRELTGNQTDRYDSLHRLRVFSGIGVVEVLALIVAQIAIVIGCQKASLRLHSTILHAILRSPMSFFDTTPVGRILNRLSRDFEVIDNTLPTNIGIFFGTCMQVILVIALISYSIPPFLFAFIPLTFLYIVLLAFFLPSSRQLRRLENVNRSPVLSLFGESIQGVASIRAYNKLEATHHTFGLATDVLIQCKYFSLACYRWLGLRLEVLGNFVVLAAAITGILSSRYTDISPAMIGLAVSYALMFTEMVYCAVRNLSDLEADIVSVERVEEFTNLEAEREWRSATPPPKSWPSAGEIECDGFSTRYRKELPLVIRKLSVSTRPGEKFAVVGRTGSGKSSLTLALYRIIEADEGKVIIDGIDISTVGLHDLREKITIIPQEPVLFSGTLRFNIDPFSQYSDEQIWKALEACQLRDFVVDQPEKLQYEICEGGQNMSVGQRQLVCLGRALLRKGRILVLDEATAACDHQTDALVQHVIRTEFAEATVIAIAHRINTISDYDRILVLDKGTLVEVDSPQALMADPESQYAKMVEKAERHG